MNTPWLVPIVLKCVLVYLFGSWFMKKMVSLPSRTQRFFLQFLFCSILALAIAAYQGALSLNGSFLVLLAIGFFNGLAAFCQWKAIDINLSKNSLFTVWDDVIAMGLSCVILNETKVLNHGLVAGILICLITVVLFAFYSYKKSSTSKTTNTPPAFFFYVGTYSVIWGVATFFMRSLAWDWPPISWRHWQSAIGPTESRRK